jgi:hypothetical protein
MNAHWRTIPAKARRQNPMTTYLSMEPMTFGMRGSKVTDLDWDIKTGRRCAQSHAKKEDGHICKNIILG